MTTFALPAISADKEFDSDDLLAGGHAFKAMLGEVDIDKSLSDLRKAIPHTKSPTKRDALVRKLKYLTGLQKNEQNPVEAYTLAYMPVVPPTSRPPVPQGGNQIKYADSNILYRDHMLVNTPMKDNLVHQPNSMMGESRKALYEGAKAVVGTGEAITGSSRGENLKGFLKQIGGENGPKTGLFQSKILSKKQDFSGRATIYAEPNLGFNEAAVPVDMLWTMYSFHIIRDLVRSGYDYVSAKKAVEARNPAATNSFNRMIKEIPVLLNRAPTLMQSNITAHFPVPVKGRTIGINPLHLPLYAGDIDGDALSCFVPLTPESVLEAKNKLLPKHHTPDFRRGIGSSMLAPGHEAILGSTFITEPDVAQATVHFATEVDAISALKAGTISENTPIAIG
jgi:DNA-directed RNA polymerase subunit beta'